MAVETGSILGLPQQQTAVTQTRQIDPPGPVVRVPVRCFGIGTHSWHEQGTAKRKAHHLSHFQQLPFVIPFVHNTFDFQQLGGSE